MAFQNLFILGATGQVGTELVRQITEYDGINHEHRNPTNIAGVANSTNFILSPGGVAIPEDITRENMKDFLDGSDDRKGYTSHTELLEAVRKSGMEGDIIFVDVTAEGPKMVEFHKSVIGETANRIVTANKKPASADMATFKLLTGNPHRVRYNTTVMAGAGAVPYFQESHGLSEKVESVEGTFSGTLAYVCSELEKGEKPFSQIVSEARAAGYTEPHPIDDLNGEDVQRKLLILLRSAGISIEASDVELRGFVDPETYKDMGAEDFLEAIKGEDEKIGNQVKESLAKGFVPRYVASYKERDGVFVARVGLQFVEKDSELGNLKGTANKILVHTSQRTPLRSAPHIIQSPGAGVPKTAASVTADLLYLLSGTNLWQHN